MSDLDARVAALMVLADKHASSGMKITADQFVNRKDTTQAKCDHLADYEALESAIRAELQKPAEEARGVDAEPVEKRLDLTAFTDMALVRESDILRSIADNLEVLLASAIQHQSDECVTGYTVKTGALHHIIGLLVGNGFRVNIPIPPPASTCVESVPATPISLPSAHEWLDANSWEGSQEWMSGWDAARNRLQTIQLQTHPAPSQPAAPVELPVVAWRHRDPAWSGWATTNEAWKTNLPIGWEEEPLVKLSDAQAAIAAGRKAS